MTLYAKREIFGKASEKFGKPLAKIPLTPNQWTLLGLLPMIISAYFIFRNDFLVSAVFFALAIMTDWVDGSVARATKKASKFGSFVDGVTDKYIEGILVLGLLLASLPTFIIPAYYWIFFFFFGSFMSTFVKARAKEAEFVKTEVRGGLIERPERLILLLIGLILASIQPIYLIYIIVLLGVLGNITAIQRVFIARKKGFNESRGKN